VIQIEWGIPLSILFVVLDLLIAATRVSLLNLRPLRLLSLREQSSEAVDRTLALVEDARLRPTLRFSQTATRILLAGIILSMAGQAAGESRFALVIMLVIIFFVALTLMVVEFTVEGNILRDPRLGDAPGNVRPRLDLRHDAAGLPAGAVAQIAMAGAGGSANDRR
jgi:hypothetical protein